MTFEVACSNSFGTSSLILFSVLSGTGLFGLHLFGPEVNTAFLVDRIAISTVSSQQIYKCWSVKGIDFSIINFICLLVYFNIVLYSPG